MFNGDCDLGLYLYGMHTRRVAFGNMKLLPVKGSCSRKAYLLDVGKAFDKLIEIDYI